MKYSSKYVHMRTPEERRKSRLNSLKVKSRWARKRRVLESWGLWKKRKSREKLSPTPLKKPVGQNN